MLTIDHLSLGLPAGFEHRADRIARLVSHELARLPLTADRTLDRLHVPQVEIFSGATDTQIAMRIASAIHTSLERQR